MREKLTMAIISLLCLSVFSIASPSVLALVTVMPTRLPQGIQQAASVWDGTKAFIFGGGSRIAGPFNHILKYDPTTGAIVTMAAVLPDPVTDSPAVWTGQYVYSFGGWIAQGATSDKIVRYDPLTDTITVMGAKLPTYAFPVYSMSAVWDGNYVYLFGGYDGYSFLNQILRYDPVQDQLTTMSSRMPTPIKWNSAVWSGTYAYIFGGLTPSGVTDQIFRYDPTTDTVAVTSGRLPFGLYVTSAVWTGEYAYVFGGGTQGETEYATDKIIRYDPELDFVTIMDESLPSPRRFTCAIWDGNSAYIFGGEDSERHDLDEIVRFSPQTPDFEISVSPDPHIRVHVGGWNNSASLALKSINGFSGSVQLSFAGPSEANINISFSQNPVYLTEGSQATVGMIVSSTSAALSEYNFVIVAESGLIRHELGLKIKLVGNIAAIKNLVYLKQMPASNPAFSIQQNFIIAAPNGSAIYWAQNVVNGRPVPRSSRRVITSIFQVWTWPDLNRVLSVTDFVNYVLSFVYSRAVSFPVVINMTSHVDGNKLVMENNASSRFNTYTLNLPEGSYIVGYTAPLGNFDHRCPEIAIVDTPFDLTAKEKIAYFTPQTSGSVENSVTLVGESDWRQTQNKRMNLEVGNRPQTEEKSCNLKWYTEGIFQHSSGSTDQGLAFSPNYH